MSSHCLYGLLLILSISWDDAAAESFDLDFGLVLLLLAALAFFLGGVFAVGFGARFFPAVVVGGGGFLDKVANAAAAATVCPCEASRTDVVAAAAAAAVVARRGRVCFLRLAAVPLEVFFLGFEESFIKASASASTAGIFLGDADAEAAPPPGSCFKAPVVIPRACRAAMAAAMPCSTVLLLASAAVCFTMAALMLGLTYGGALAYAAAFFKSEKMENSASS